MTALDAIGSEHARRRPDVVVVGGGVAGATAAATATLAGARVLVLAGASSPGRAATDRRDGFLLNRGAHGLYDLGAGRAVLEGLGIAVHGATSPLAGALGRRGDDIDVLPLGGRAAESTRLLSPGETARLAAVLADQRRWRPERLATLTIEDWVDGFGLPPAAREVFELFIRWATYCAAHDRVAADVAATQLRIASGGITYVHGGWSTLVDALLGAVLRGGGAVEPATATRVEPLTGGGVEVCLGEDRVAAPAVVLAAGGPAAAGALLPEPPVAWSAPGPQISAACLDLGLDHVPGTAALLGVDRPLYLIRHAPPADLAPSGHSVVHVMKYLHPDEAGDRHRVRAELDHHATLAGAPPDRALVARYLHRMPVVSAAATPGAGGLAGRPAVTSSGHRDVLVAGDWIGPLGHLADASFASADTAGRLAAARAHRASRRRAQHLPG